jgi:hypothetical protein
VLAKFVQTVTGRLRETGDRRRGPERGRSSPGGAPDEAPRARVSWRLQRLS